MIQARIVTENIGPETRTASFTDWDGMVPERTVLEWVYRPEDLFEAAYRHVSAEWELVIDGGRAIATLSVPQGPVAPALEGRIAAHLHAVLLVRQLQVHRICEVESPPRIYQHAEGRRSGGIRLGAACVVVSGGQADLVHRDGAGNILRDTRAERIAEHAAMLDAVAPKLALSTTLNGLLTSYSRAVSDGSNELVHLYEIRDALATHYEGEQNARAALSISRSEWQRLGVLANVEPLEQGRHRGGHVSGRRVATLGELEEARSIARKWMIVFASLI
jgi:hypothetical protein